MSRNILVQGDKEFRITVPDDSSLTFGPFSPPAKDVRYTQESKTGTLRVYEGNSKTKILAVFSGVRSFRDTTNIEYEEKVAVEEGATVWKNDRNGYTREEKVSRKEQWVSETDGLLETSEEEF